MKIKFQAGFTLIELLVVIAIITILAALLLPALSRAKEASYQAKCTSNLKQWGSAQNMYVDDNQGVFPETKIPADPPITPSGYNEDQPTWSDLTDIQVMATQKGVTYGMDAWFNALPPYVASRPLWQYAITSDSETFNTAPSIFLCPTSALLPQDPNVLAGQIVFNYGMNSKGAWDLPDGQYVKSADVVRPAAYVMFSEVRTHTNDVPYYGTNTVNNTILGSPQCYTTRESARHTAGANIVFEDCHVTYYKYSYVCMPSPGGPADPGQADINWAADATTVPPP